MPWFPWSKKDPAKNTHNMGEAAGKAAWLKRMNEILEKGISDEDRINECINRMQATVRNDCEVLVKQDDKRIPVMYAYLVDYAKNPRSNGGQAVSYISWLTSIEGKTKDDRINQCIEDMKPRVLSYCRAEIERQNESIPEAKAAAAAAATAAAASATTATRNPLFGGGNRKRKNTRKVQRKKARKTRRN